jgi:ribosomal protein S18 acetylase RimI-like enzyme
VFNGWINRLNPSAARLANGFVWLADGRIVGNATLLTTKAWDRYLVANVAVHPSFRRQGIGRALMHSITSTVKTRGGRVILLQVVKDNQSAKDLYLSLGYEYIGDMTTWYASASRLRQLADNGEKEQSILIRPLADRRWREAFALDTEDVHADLNWPEPLQYDAYRRTLWKRAADFMNGRQMETWATTDSQDHLTGLATIYSEWGRSHLVTLRVRPDWRGRLERPLLAKAIRRLRYLPRRNVRIDHPEHDEYMSQLLKEANFTVQRTLSHMRLDLSRRETR